MTSLAKKLGSTRNISGVEYLIPTRFNKYFPYVENKNNPDDALGEGGSGAVFRSGDKYIVKEYIDVNNKFEEFVEELDIYAAFEHPCILKPVAWTINEGTPLLAMERGEDIVEAYRLGKITIRQIIYD